MSVLSNNAYYRQLYERSFSKQFPLERFLSKSSTGGFRPSVGDRVDFRPNPALSAGVAAMTEGRWRSGRVEATITDPARGMIVTVRDLDNDSTCAVHVNRQERR